MSTGEAAGATSRPATTEERRRLQRTLAERWKGGASVGEVAGGAGMTPEEAERQIAWGLLQMGEVTVDDLVRSGHYRPRGHRVGDGPPRPPRPPPAPGSGPQPEEPEGT